jgi:CRP-like cAMP-binding protein
VTAHHEDARSSSSNGPANQLLARLPEPEYAEVRPHLTSLRMPAGRVLSGPHVSCRHIYFPTRGVFVVGQSTSEGRTVGVALVGNEGVLGLTALGGDPESGVSVMTMTAGCEAQTIAVDAFRHLMTRLAAFNAVIHQFVWAFDEGLVQSVACHASHSVQQRLAKCLLEIRDRLGRPEAPVTHETLADLLGVRRESVTVALSRLERAGLVRVHRKLIRLTDPDGLMAAACECYRIVIGHFARLLP